jgi:hypothetical protein
MLSDLCTLLHTMPDTRFAGAGEAAGSLGDTDCKRESPSATSPIGSITTNVKEDASVRDLLSDSHRLVIRRCAAQTFYIIVTDRTYSEYTQQFQYTQTDRTV